MRGYDPDFIQKRLEHDIRQYKGTQLYANTGLWVDAPEILRQQLPQQFLRPVLYSISLNDGATVIGVEEICVISDSKIETADLNKLENITSDCIVEGKPRTEWDSISIIVEGKKIRLPTQAGPACFTIWNKLLIFANLKKRA